MRMWKKVLDDEALVAAQEEMENPDTLDIPEITEEVK
jgi:hypothetical protein